VVLGLPDAKPFYVGFSDDYYYRITRTGSLIEKAYALMTLTSTEARFFRVDPNSDVSRYSINFYQLFRNEVVRLMSGIIRNDSSGYTATMNGAVYQPTPIVDLSTYGVPNAPTPPYAQPGAIHIATPINRTIRYTALLWGLARLGSTWDATLDFQNFLAIAVKGSDDDFQITGAPVNEFTHPVTGVTYRAPTYTSPNNIGSEILDELKTIVGNSADPVTATMPARFGLYLDSTPLPTWYAAKAALTATSTGADQAAYQLAMKKMQVVEQVLNYRLDLISDIRTVRKQLNLGILN
jgi:hypothetical protein